MLVTWRDTTDVNDDGFTNTLYFNVSGSIDPPDYTALTNDLATIYRAQGFTGGREVRVVAYDMADAKPRVQRAVKTVASSGTKPQGPGQVALCLSYYCDRNLPRQRGRLYTGPYTCNIERPSLPVRTTLLNLTDALAGLGGLNVDWSLYSPTTGEHTRISNTWVDDSWDIIRSRKLPGTNWISKSLNG